MPKKKTNIEQEKAQEPETRYISAKNALLHLASTIYDQLHAGDIPRMELPLRSKQNIQFDLRSGVWKLNTATLTRSCKKLDGALGILRAISIIDFIDEMVKTNKSSTLRELYYISEQWDIAKFHSEDESNKLVEDLEIITKHLREDFKLRPEENGASIIGNITIEETDRKGKIKKINCRDDVGDSGYALPYNIEKDKIKIVDWDAKFVLGIECGGMFDRLVENGFDEKFGAILVHLKGQPARCTRRFIKRLNTECNLPVLVFTDGDPWSFRIFASVAYGAIKTAHISEYLATPAAQFLGVTASDIENYALPSDKLNDKDIKALHAEQSDPRFADDFWKQEIQLMLDINKKAEQQSLAKYGLNFVTDKYLPDKLRQLGVEC